MAAGLGAAARAALASALGTKHGGIVLHRTEVVEKLVAYHGDRGEALTDLPLDVPRDGVEAHARRWRAKLSAAGVVDLGDQEDFIQWAQARSAPAGSGGSGTASVLAKAALLALEESGDRPSVAGITNLERALVAGEAGDEDSQCCNAIVAYNLLWGRDPTPHEEEAWLRQKATLGGRLDGRIDITTDEKYGKMCKSADSVGRVTLRRALKSATPIMFEDWKVDMSDMLHAKNLPKAAARLDKVVAHGRRQAHGVWEAQREYFEGYFFRECLGMGLPKVIAEASGLICAGSPLVLAARIKGQQTGVQDAFMKHFVAPGSTSSGTPSTFSQTLTDLGSLDSVSQVGGSSVASDSSGRVAELEAKLKASEEARFADRVDNRGRCKYCLQDDCPFSKGGKPCRSYWQGINYLNEQRAARRKQREAGRTEEDKTE